MTFPTRSPVGGRIVKSERLDWLMTRLETQENEPENVLEVSKTSQYLDTSSSLNSTNSSANSGLLSEDNYSVNDESFSPMKRSTLRRSLKSFKKRLASH